MDRTEPNSACESNSNGPKTAESPKKFLKTDISWSASSEHRKLATHCALDLLAGRSSQREGLAPTPRVPTIDGVMLECFCLTLSSEMHRRGKVFGFRFVAGGVGEDEVVAEINWIM